MVVAAAVALPLLLDVERYRGKIETALASATGWNAELGQIGFSVWRGLVLTVSPVKLAAPGDSSRIEIETLEIRASILPLLRGKLEIKSVDLVRPKIALVRPTKAKGWVLPKAGPPKAPSAPAPGQTDEAPVAVTVHTVRISDGSLALDDRASDPPFQVALAGVSVALAAAAGTIDGEARLEPSGGKLAFAGSLEQGLKVTVAELPTESLHPFLGTELIHAGGTLSGDAALTLPPRIQGTIVGRSITLLAGNRPLDEMRATFDVSGGGGTWSLSRLDLTAGGLAVQGTGPIVPNVNLRFTLAPTPLEAALAAAPSILPVPLDLRPPGSIEADVRVVATSGGTIVPTAKGKLTASELVVSDMLPPAKDVEAEFELERSGAFEVRILGGTIAGGPAKGVARLSSIDPPGTLTFDGSLEDAVFGGLLGGLVDKADSITGPTGLKANLGLDLARPTIDARALSGRLDLASRDVRFPVDLEKAVMAKLEEKLGALAALTALTGRGAQDSATETDGDGRLIRELTASVDFDRWPWGLERLAFDADELAASGGGTFDPEQGAVALELIAKLSPGRTKRLVDRTKQLSRLVGQDGRLALPLKVKGSLLAPSVEVDVSKALAGAGATKEEAVKGLIEGLLDRKKRK